MRHKSRTILSALVAVLVLGVAASASASASAALPEFVPAEGGFPITVEGTNRGGKSDFSNTSGGGWAGECSGTKVSGSITGAKALSLTIQLQYCEMEEGKKCYTAGEKVESGNETMTGNASLVYISREKKELGVLFTLNPSEFYCGTQRIRARGTLLSPITPVNVKTSTFSLALRGNTKGVPTYNRYENEKGEQETTKLEVNYFSGYVSSALEVAGELKLTTSKSLTIEG